MSNDGARTAEFAKALNTIGAVAPRAIFADLGADIPTEVLESPWGQQPLEHLRIELRRAVAVSLDFLNRLTGSAVGQKQWRQVMIRLEELDELLKDPASTDDQIREVAAHVVRDTMSIFRTPLPAPG